MKILIDKKLEKRLEKNDIQLLTRTKDLLAKFPLYFKDLNDYDKKVVRKINTDKFNVYSAKVDLSNRLIFTAAFDPENTLNIALLDVIKKDKTGARYVSTFKSAVPNRR